MKLALLNTSILTATGNYTLEDITLQQAKKLVKENELDSAIGHQATADIMSVLLDVPISVNRQFFKQEIGQHALVFKLNGRPKEGKILTVEEINDIGYSFMLLTRNKEEEEEEKNNTNIIKCNNCGGELTPIYYDNNTYERSCFVDDLENYGLSMAYCKKCRNMQIIDGK